MVLNKYRHLLPRFVNGPVNFCIKHKITPNKISIFGFLLSVTASIMLALPQYFLRSYTIVKGDFWWFWACVPAWLFFISAYTDVLDGAVARKTNEITRYGGFLDSTLDRLSDSVFVLGMMIGRMFWPWDDRINILIGFTCLSVTFLISYTRSRAELEGVVMKGIGFMERAERVFMILIGFGIEWAFFGVEEFYYGGWKTQWFFPIFAIVYTLLLIHTLVERIVWTYKWLNNKMPDTVAKLLAEEKQKKIQEGKSAENEAPKSSENAVH